MSDLRTRMEAIAEILEDVTEESAAGDYVTLAGIRGEKLERISRVLDADPDTPTATAEDWQEADGYYKDDPSLLADPDTPTATVDEGTQRALDARCSQCGHPFRDHKSHLDPTERGGLRSSMTCPTGTPTADAAADTDLRIALARALCDDEHELPGLCVSGYAQADEVLPLVRARVEAARQDTLNQAADEVKRIRERGLRPGETYGPYTKSFENWLRDRAVRGEAAP